MTTVIDDFSGADNLADTFAPTSAPLPLEVSRFYDSDDFVQIDNSDAPYRQRLDIAANRWCALSDEIASLEEMLALKKQQLQECSRNEVSELLYANDLTEYQAPNGRTLILAPKTYAQVRKDNKPFVLKWLQDNGYGADLSWKCTITLPTKSEALAKRMQDLLKLALPTEDITITLPDRLATLKPALEAIMQQVAPKRKVEFEPSIHGGTLGKIVRHRHASGSPVPEQIGYFNPTEVIVKPAAGALDGIDDVGDDE